MKAILITEKGAAGNLTINEYAKPESREGFVLIKNKAFGVNRGSLYAKRQMG